MYIHGEVEILYWKNWIYVDIKKIGREMMPIMKKFLKVILCFIGLICAIVLIFLMSISYITNYKKVTVDTSNSPNGQYELVLQAVGEPDWPFGLASGRLVLKEGKDKVSETDFGLTVLTSRFSI